MADVYEPTGEQESRWLEWCSSRPEPVREVAERFRPWRLYQLKSSGHRVVVHSFDEHEDGQVTLRVDVLGMFNQVTFERRVFGIEPDDLVECELPPDDEKLGADLTDPQEVETFVEAQRERVAAGLAPRFK